MAWWQFLTLGLVLVLFYAYWGYRRDCRRLCAALAPLAQRHQGAVTAGRLFTLPQLRFSLEGRPLLATAMASSGAIGKARGPFTFVEITLEQDSGQEILIEGRSPLHRAGERLAESFGPEGPWYSGDADFDQAFAVKGGDGAFLTALLDGPLREGLLNARLPDLEMRLQGRRASVHCDGIVDHPAVFEEMIVLCRRLAQNCAGITWRQ